LKKIFKTKSERENGTQEKKKLSKGKKRVIIAAALIAVAVGAACYYGGIFDGSDDVAFTKIDDDDIPEDIKSNVIPEYRTLERALACAVDDDIYVIVTRGEKPTSGYEVSVAKIVLEDNGGEENLVVYAMFTDPDAENPISQVITYPTEVVKTDLKNLPDTIELRIQY